jgi:ribonuclease P protein component
MALPSNQRLKRTRDFAAVREHGTSWSSRCLILATRPRPESLEAHAGFTTTKRIGNAVVRNKVRRRLRSIVKEFYPQLAFPHDIVTIAKFPATKSTYEALRHEWQRLAQKAGLLATLAPAPKKT